MFVRVKSSPNSPKKAVQIVESLREGTKVKQRIVRHVGNALDESELIRLRELAEHIKAKIELESQPGFFAPEQMAEMAIEARNNQQEKPLPVDLSKLREQQRIITGIHEVYGKVYNELGFDKVFPNATRKPAAVKNLFHLVMGRLANPLSKRATVADLAENFGVELSLPSVYRMMDLIDDKVIGNIQNTAYQCAREIFQSRIKVVFYDCTTLYFESFTEDELKKNGYSKDMKFNQPQVLLALMVTDHGLPIGYEVFPGSQYEGHTLENAIKKIEEKYQIKQIVFVADSAMFNTDNLELLESMGKHYIVAARIKNLPIKITNTILDKQGYKPINLQDNQKEYSFKEVSLNKRRLVVTYNASNARKDAHDRQKAVDKLLSKIQKSKTNNPSELISNYGYKKFIKLTGDASFQIDDEKIEQAKQWDGLHGVITNQPDLDVQQIISQYHGLWQVEECFRISKHDLKVRPIFHWTPARVKAHIAICFIALTCSRYLHYRVKIQQYRLSTERVRQLLTSVQLSILKHVSSDQLYGIPSLMKQDTSKIYQVMGLKLSDVPFQIK
jgi:transposase